ncbi:MAG: phycobiliprotein lyase [Gloeocapsa sp. DLM2.Bin57]|nr:MAG: phycobiliprotein lyase [Gloeocapsa sp. DLM2.Bin57]
MDAMEFFQRSAGKWRSLRTTHHLPFRRAETGDSNIVVESLEANHPSIKEICEIHAVNPQLSVGGALVEWNASMAWDKEDENHSGKTVFALIPEETNPKQGQLLRERGYAEIMPVAGDYYIDEEEALVLVTEYETMSIFERFWFVGENMRVRTSTVKRFGGFNTATFSVEIRTQDNQQQEQSPETKEATELFSLSGW